VVAHDVGEIDQPADRRRNERGAVGERQGRNIDHAGLRLVVDGPLQVGKPDSERLGDERDAVEPAIALEDLGESVHRDCRARVDEGWVEEIAEQRMRRSGAEDGKLRDKIADDRLGEAEACRLAAA
jgi:hypothetical protein